jgi:hypothetical protein
MSEQESTVEELERETIREAMRILGSKKSKRKTEACRANARIRWAKERAEKARKSVKA